MNLVTPQVTSLVTVLNHQRFLSQAESSCMLSSWCLDSWHLGNENEDLQLQCSEALEASPAQLSHVTVGRAAGLPFAPVSLPMLAQQWNPTHMHEIAHRMESAHVSWPPD